MKTILLTAMFCTLAVASTQAATFAVSTTNDAGPGSLRLAILDSNTDIGNSTIIFTTNGTIILSSPLPTITNNTAILGPGTNLLTVSGNNSAQVFSFNKGTTNIILGLTIANGLATGYVNGAAIANAGRLTVVNCVLVNNTNLSGWGGAIFNAGYLTISNSILSGNVVIGGNGSGASSGASAGGGGAGMGGGLFTISGTAIVTGCTFNGNGCIGGNGGGYNSGTGTGIGGGINGGGVGNQYSGGGAGGLGGGGGGGGFCQNGGAGGLGGGSGGGGACNAGFPGAGLAGLGGGPGGYGAIIAGGPGGGGGALGGGIFIESGRVMIADSSFEGNQVTGGIAGAGGGLAGPASNGNGIGAGVFVDKGTVSLVSCVFGSNEIVGSGSAPNFHNSSGTLLPIMSATSPGGGNITADPPTPPYLNDSQVTLTATPYPGWQFLYWLGDASVVSLN